MSTPELPASDGQASDASQAYRSLARRAYPARLTGSRVPSRKIATRLSFAYSSTRAIRSTFNR